MNKDFLPLLAFVALAFAPAVSASEHESGVRGVIPGAQLLRESPRAADSTLQALCREVDVALDEGYGVSRHETRVVCQPD
jgi:hypothetical protein